jgi:hypothetical protein
MTPSPAATVNQQRNHMRNHLAERYEPGEVFELRIHLRHPHPVTTKHGTHDTSIVAGRFNEFEAAIEGILTFEGLDVDCIWTSVNKIEEQSARFVGGWAMNELKVGATTTRDYYVNWHNWYVVDFDVLRPDDVNATEAEGRQPGARCWPWSTS